MSQLENIETIEKRLWSSADNLRANSNYASNEYFLPVMGLIFLRHAYSRYMAVKDKVEAGLPRRGGKIRPPTKEDFSRKGAILLQPEAQFEYLVSLPEGKNLAQAIVQAMDSIEEDYESLKGVLPKAEYQELDNEVLAQLLRTFNDPALRQTSGDIFGRIYEYFLTQFADLKAHDDGEFFTPVSLVQTIVNVIEPDHGKVLDPACGSGGMFVQSAHFIEHLHKNPTEQVTFYGLEKNATTIRLAKMNLAVHGLEGDIQKAITYYEDPHEMVGKADFVMANPPFNVDEIDSEKIKNDPRLAFGLPGVNKKKKVSNGNYVWISWFYSYLNPKGRSGFVMSSQASSAGRDEATVRRKLIETGHVDVMISIRSNFFYTRTVPCELWFFDRAKPKDRQDKVLMLDARNMYRQVTRKIFDFSPEQMQNLSSIVWLYRGQQDRFLDLVAGYLQRTVDEAEKTSDPLQGLKDGLKDLLSQLEPFLKGQAKDGPHTETWKEWQTAYTVFMTDIKAFAKEVGKMQTLWQKAERNAKGLGKAAAAFTLLAEQSRDLIKQADLLYKLITRLIETSEKEMDARKSGLYNGRDVNRARKDLDEVRKTAVDQLRQVRYFHKQAHWLLERFPNAELRDVEGLVRLVDRSQLEANDWSLTPGRYVGVAPEEEDENFDFEEAIREIHTELVDLNKEAVDLAARIQRNFEGLGI